QHGLFMLLKERKLQRPDSPLQGQPYDKMILKNVGFDHTQPLFYQFTLPTREARELLRLLAAQGIDASTIYPGYDGVARALRERMQFDSIKGWRSRATRLARRTYRTAWRRLQR